MLITFVLLNNRQKFKIKQVRLNFMRQFYLIWAWMTSPLFIYLSFSSPALTSRSTFDFIPPSADSDREELIRQHEHRTVAWTGNLPRDEGRGKP